MENAHNGPMVCAYRGCERDVRDGSEHCMFHMSVKEKADHWRECNDLFVELIDRGTLNFDGFVLKDVDLSGRKLKGNVSFINASFLGQTSFRNVVFKGSADFHGSRFEDADFSGASFMGRAFFSPDGPGKGPTFRKADFRDSYFEKGGSFDDCVIPDGDFSQSTIRHVSFNGVVLDNILFTGSQMEFAYLSDSLWNAPEGRTGPRRLLEWISVSDGRYIIREEMEVRGRMGSERRVNGYKDAEGTYRRIKHSLNNEGDYEKAGEFYIREMRMKRKRYREQHRLLKWLAFWLSAVVTGYGEKWRNVVMSAFAIVLIYAVAYYAVGAISPDGEDYDADFRESLYFSVVTFTTLGYGDYAPITEYQLLAVSEAFIGAFTIALFVLVFGRKMMR